jgi:hypothetical protein
MMQIIATSAKPSFFFHADYDHSQSGEDSHHSLIDMSRLQAVIDVPSPFEFKNGQKLSSADEHELKSTLDLYTGMSIKTDSTTCNLDDQLIKHLIMTLTQNIMKEDSYVKAFKKAMKFTEPNKPKD